MQMFAAAKDSQQGHGMQPCQCLCRGKGRKVPQPAITAAGAARSALRSGCKDVPLESVERYNLLKRCAGMLPPSSQAAHEPSILARRHVEYLDPAVMLQVLSKVTTFGLAILKTLTVIRPLVNLWGLLPETYA